MQPQTITIAPRFNARPTPATAANVCGLMAREIRGVSEASLRAPPPLGRPLTLTQSDDGVVTVHDGETLLGEARPATATLDLTPPRAPTLAEAEAAARRYVGLHDHRYPTCFTCGTGRPGRDGLALFTGPVADRNMVACTWTPTADLIGADGRVEPQFIHAALDCPSYWALPRAGAMAALLARLTASIDGPLPRLGDTLIVAAWPIASEGRKHRGAAALYTSAGAVIARAEALWIEPKSAT